MLFSSLRLLLPLLILLFSSAAYGQAPAWQHVSAITQLSGNFSNVNATAAGSNGDQFLVGSFNTTISIGSTNLTSVGASDIFVVKWSAATGGFVWAQRVGGAGIEQASSIAVVGNSIYIGGIFYGSTTSIGPLTLTNSSPSGTSDVFVAKLTDAGTTAAVVWAQGAGGSSDDEIQSLAVSGANVYAAGSFSSATASFGGVTLVNASASGVSYDGFVTKLTDTGPSANFSWAQKVGGSNIDYAQAVAVSGNSVYVTGYFGSATASFGSLTLINASASTLFDIFVTKLTDLGSSAGFIWAQRAGGTSSDVANTIAVSGSSVYVAGGFYSSTASFGATTLTNAVSSPVNSNVFVAKLSDTGASASFVWAQQAGGADLEQVDAMVVSGPNIYAAGYFKSSNAAFGATTLSSAGGTDAFVSKLTDAGASGAFLWTRQAGGAGNDYAKAVTLTSAAVYVSGYVNPPAVFGSLTVASPTGTSTGYLASLPDNTVSATIRAELPGLTLYPNPAHTRVMVTMPVVPGTSQAMLTLTDALGRPVRTQLVVLSAGRVPHELGLLNLAAGLYILRIQVGGRFATRVLAVE